LSSASTTPDTTRSATDPAGAHPRRPAVARWHAALATLAVLAFTLAPHSDWSRGVYLLGVTGAVVAMFVVTRGRSDLVPWKWVTAAMVVNSAADWAASVQRWMDSDAFAWHVLDLVYLVAYAGFVRALLLLARNRERTSVVDRVIELWSIVAVIGLVTWFVLIQPALNAGSPPLERLIAVGYPLFALFLVTLTAWTFLVRGRRSEPGLIALGAGLTTWLLADLGHSMQATVRLAEAQPSKLLDIGWMTGSVLIAMGCVQASVGRRGAEPPPPRRAGWARVAIGATLILIPMVVHVIRDVREGHGAPWPSLVTAVVLTGLSVWRTLRLRGESDRAWTLLRARERRAQALAANSSDAVLIVDPEGRLLHGREDAQRLMGSELDIQDDTPAWHLISEVDQARGMAVMGRCIEAPGEVFSTELRVNVPDGPPRWFSFRAINLSDDPDIGGIVVNVHNIDDRKQAERQLQHRATHDALTGLPNRSLFHGRVSEALERGEHTQEPCAALFIDLDGFKAVNDSLGHDAGDSLLRVVAERLRSVTPRRHTVARLGGDEFGVLLEDGNDIAAEASALAESILDALGTEVPVQGQSLHPRASIGVALSRPGEDAATVLRHADLAMYDAKNSGRGRWHVFESQMEAELEERLRIEHDLSGAIGGGQLRLEYQPIVQLATDRLRGFEALLRWEHPTLGRLGPDRFVPVAESTGLILPIGEWVLEQACSVMARWEAELPHDPPLTMAVNVSAKQLADPGFGTMVRDVLQRHGIEPHLLVLELTETSLITRPEVVAARLDELRDLGVRLAIDDFGTGYSSLNHLRRFPVDIVKVDREFTSMIESADDVPAIVRALLDLSRTLGLEVVAEGVETKAQLDGLRGEHCGAGQGYYFARPLDEGAAEALLARSFSPSAGVGRVEVRSTRGEVSGAGGGPDSHRLTTS
jgi:diguanylate cyclase (GGDEF)-like protein/PAS domain S-box-containing protein